MLGGGLPEAADPGEHQEVDRVPRRVQQSGIPGQPNAGADQSHCLIGQATTQRLNRSPLDYGVGVDEDEQVAGGVLGAQIAPARVPGVRAGFQDDHARHGTHLGDGLRCGLVVHDEDLGDPVVDERAHAVAQHRFGSMGQDDR